MISFISKLNGIQGLISLIVAIALYLYNVSFYPIYLFLAGLGLGYYLRALDYHFNSKSIQRGRDNK